MPLILVTLTPRSDGYFECSNIRFKEDKSYDVDLRALRVSATALKRTKEKFYGSLQSEGG